MVLLFLLFPFGSLSLSSKTASSGAQQLFYAVPRETADLGICTFCKAIYSTGIASNISILVLCVLVRAPVAPSLSVFPA